MGQAAVLDLEINEGETWDMTIELWENADKTIPVDLAGWTYSGAFQIGNQYIPMTIDITTNAIQASIAFRDLEDLSATNGKYDIEAYYAGTDEKYRLIQGTIRVDKEITTHGAS